MAGNRLLLNSHRDRSLEIGYVFNSPISIFLSLSCFFHFFHRSACAAAPSFPFPPRVLGNLNYDTLLHSCTRIHSGHNGRSIAFHESRVTISSISDRRPPLPTVLFVRVFRETRLPIVSDQKRSSAIACGRCRFDCATR